MTDITDEQRAAWAEVKDQAYDVAKLLAPLLPSELTNPQPVLPTEPGLYVGPGGTRGPVFRHEGRDTDLYADVTGQKADPLDGPFRRLVIEGDA